jgi:hypothetical protein
MVRKVELSGPQEDTDPNAYHPRSSQSTGKTRNTWLYSDPSSEWGKVTERPFWGQAWGAAEGAMECLLYPHLCSCIQKLLLNAYSVPSIEVSDKDIEYYHSSWQRTARTMELDKILETQDICSLCRRRNWGQRCISFPGTDLIPLFCPVSLLKVWKHSKKAYEPWVKHVPWIGSLF